MDVREKLVELLTNSPQLDVLDWTTGWEEAANYLIANGVTVQEWIPISEPPKENGTYIVCTDKGGVLLSHLYGNKWGGGYAAKHITHWMHKPQPPKGE